MIDIYCERVAPGLLAEPINAATNLAFFVAAFFAWRLATERRALTPSITLLVLLLVAIGCGSLLFHTFATRWAMLADVVPILLFQLVFLWLYTGQVAGLGWPARLAALAAWLGAGFGVAQFPGALNGSLAYGPALVALLLLGVYHARHATAGHLLLLQASGVLLLSLALRTLDLGVCPLLPLGTHFLWHLLNGVVLYLSIRALVLYRPNPPA